ncbi:hybrid sensor histidine kinase/response regulator [Rheinheimera riviphila]|uniref:Chemotaxis protein CheA n=1 Tax=Rheinheimera riviphila TaxID=1834037 RepID=A0A437QF34_9GAMM|nr:response regulator [Rheinheimera riviphila]RVU33136.1 hybrid sensor histidine kinase/response regulator [Rheinheimera riviphila]
MDHQALQQMLLLSFRQEADERLQLLADQLASRAANNADPVQVENLFREVHSLKGAARAVGQRDTEQLCHHWESLLAAARRTPALLHDHNIELCRQALHLLRLLCNSQPVPVAQRLQMQADLDVAATGQDWQQSRSAAAFTQAAFNQDTPFNQDATFTENMPFAPVALAAADSGRIRVSNQHLTSLLLLTETLQQLHLETAEQQRQLKQLVQDSAVLCKLQQQTRLYERQLRLLLEPLSATQQEPLHKMLQYLEASGSGLDQLWHGSQRLQRHAARLSAGLAQLSENMHSEMQAVLLVEGQTLFSGLAAMSQDLAQQTGKQVQFSATDQQLQLDKRIVDELKPVLQHLIRNAVDHGIETPEQRQFAGKAAFGQLTLSLSQSASDKFELKLTDDGRGIDLPGLKQRALAAGLGTAEQLDTLSDEEALQLVFQSGLSTSAMLTEISGRGLGMAIVQDIVERLAGQLSLQSVPGQGLTISMLLPSSVSTFRALLVRCNDRTLALPLFAVESCLRLDSSAVQYTQNRATLLVEARVLALWRLADILQLPPAAASASPSTSQSSPTAPTADQQHVVLMKVRGESFALLIDELLGDQDITVKSLGPQLKKAPCVFGATLLGDGQLIPILDPLPLYQKARQLQSGAPAAEEPVRQQIRILVADDSFTSRALLKSILETAGYAVTTANDGQEAWDLLQQQHIEVLVSDVEMPKLDGFHLTLKIRHHPKLENLPIILVTALHSAEDRQRGLDVGANAYLVKSGFEQESLLDSIRRLVYTLHP